MRRRYDVACRVGYLSRSCSVFLELILMITDAHIIIVFITIIVYYWFILLPKRYNNKITTTIIKFARAIYKLVDQNNCLPLFHKPIFIRNSFVGRCYNILQENRCFQVFIFPSVILEWNRIERKIRQSIIIPSFRNSYLKIGRPNPKPV